MVRVMWPRHFSHPPDQEQCTKDFRHLHNEWCRRVPKYGKLSTAKFFRKHDEMSVLYLVVVHPNICLEASKGIKPRNPLPDPSQCHWATLLHDKPAYTKQLQKMFRPIEANTHVHPYLPPAPSITAPQIPSQPLTRVEARSSGGASYYDPGPTKFSSPLPLPPSSPSMQHIPAPPEPTIRPLTPRPPLPQQPPPQFPMYQTYQTPLSWDTLTWPPPEPLIDISLDQDIDMTTASPASPSPEVHTPLDHVQPNPPASPCQSS